MTEEKTPNKILGEHLHRDGTVSEKKYIWHIPKDLRGTFEVGDVMMVEAKGRLLPVSVLAIFREEYVPGENERKMVRRRAIKRK